MPGNRHHADNSNGESGSFARMGMNYNEFRSAAQKIVDYVINYHQSLDGKQAFPSVKPGFLRKLLPWNPPEHGGQWEDLLEDFDKIIMKGMTHWHSSKFFAYLPTGNSYPSLLAAMLVDGCGSLAFSWATSPACTELETLMLDWLAKAMNLPACFIHEGVGPGCGVILGSCSEGTLMTLLSARNNALKQLSLIYPDVAQYELASRLVAYTSEYSHSSVERASLLGFTKLHKVPVDKIVSMRGEALQRAIKEDKKAGKFPFYVCATLGTTSCVSFDNLDEIGQVCQEENVFWLHVDASYAGGSFICPEFRRHMKGIEYADSITCNPQKCLMINPQFSVLWVKDRKRYSEPFKVDPSYVRHDEEDVVIDYRHMGVGFGRRFRSLKPWFVFRLIGIEGLRHRVREDVKMAKLFESLVNTDGRFEVVFPVELGVVCFRLIIYKDDTKKSNMINRQLLKQIKDSKDVFLISSEVEETFFLRLCTGFNACNENAIHNCWNVILKHTNLIL
uniref:aromatic-L-amino-acid decarboxylase-like n=1 Tax=Styela clava TaxID=7725 RepID=UPI00193ADBB1|nr:aromatic-L-amino-acid decarboxylase-like [Styela clava]XP_039272549.1 aromatic-L-amino-acid decarboxylase-like [Styela clava]